MRADQESRNPNQAGGSAAKKRGALGALDGSPSKKQQKKPSRKDRRRVSFAPDPELTLVHHFVKDDDYTSNSDGQGRVVVQYDEDVVHQPRAAPDTQHPALAGAMTAVPAAPAIGGSYRPGFWNKTVPENSPMSMERPPMDSPGMVSMELTQPTVHQAQLQAALAGEVTAGLPSLGALALADEWEAEAAGAGGMYDQQQFAAPGEVTAGLPSLGALAEVDEWEEQEQEQQHQQQQQQVAAAGWSGGAAEAAAGNMTANITAALPGLGDLVEEDEEATAGMDLTVPAGRVLEHRAVAAAAPALSPAPASAVAQSPAVAAMTAPSPTPVPAEVAPAEQHPAQVVAPLAACHPALAPAAESPMAAAELEATAPVAHGRLSSGTDELAAKEAAKAAQMNKWGFAPGQEDTLDINLEMHGRMIMGDHTFNRMYCDNTTGDTRFERPGTADSPASDSLLLSDDVEQGDGRAAAAAVTSGPVTAAAAAAVAEASPAVLQRSVQQLHEQAAPATGPSPAPPQQPQEAGGPAPAFGAPNWTAPAFLPPYLQQGPAASGAASDHPALVHSPDVTSSSLNTLETRRVSVGVGLDPRRLSVNSGRRFSMQDATGRLLVDEEDGDDGFDLGGAAAAAPATAAAHAALHSGAEAAQQAPMPAGPGMPAAAGMGAGRRASAVAFHGRDVTEKLLVDDSLDEGDTGPLADLKRQMRMLSQGSPVLAPQQQELAVTAVAAAPAQALAAAGVGMVAAEQQPAAEQLPPAKTPRASVSLGYADSHNPATMGLLRSGGTTRLLQETVHMRRRQQQLGEQDEDDDLLGLGDDDMQVQEQAGVPAGTAAAVVPATDAGGLAVGEVPDGGITARTNGTTKLLADMTMASMVGAKLLGRSTHGTPDLAHAPSNDGLTDFSLDQFECPPELPGGSQQQDVAAATAAAGGAAGAAQAMEEAAYEQLDEQLEGEGEQQQPDELLPPHPQQLEQRLAGDGYASPAVLAAAAAYPMDDVRADAVIPGGPKLARTPVPVRAASQPRSVHGTPHSQAHSMRSQQVPHHQTTPGTHGTHRLARTPGSARPPPAAYPAEGDIVADNAIPGGPKLARTPMGRTPAGAHLPVPGSAVAQHYPGSARGVHFAAGPGSASVPRYPPGSAVALQRGGMTPQFALPPPMTFQDFAKLTEIQFLDNLRRGASINYADLQPNPVPQNLGDAYRLLAIISPQVTTLESGIRILQEEVQARRVSAADAEQLVGQVNPAAFQKAQQADEEGLEALREDVGLVKKVCRQKAVYCLKDVRIQMEESRGGKLRRNLEALQADLAFAQSSREQMEAVAKAAEQYIAEQHRHMGEEDQTLREEAERRTALVCMRRAIAEETAANEQRRQQLQEVQARVAKLREQHDVVSRECESLRNRTDALQVTLMQSQGQSALARGSSPQAILKQLEDLDVLRACAGWQLESAQEDPISGEVTLRLADTFRLRLNISRVGAAASVEILPEEDCKVPASRRHLLAALAGCGERGAAAPEMRLAEASSAKVAALVQATTARLSRVADLAAELDGLRLAHPAVSDVACTPEGALVLCFVNLDVEVKFAVSLRLPQGYPTGPVQHETKIWFDGEGQITEQRIQQAVAAAAEAPGRVRSICQELSMLARSVLPRPALSQDPAFHSGWQNPLFGVPAPLSAQS